MLEAAGVAAASRLSARRRLAAAGARAIRAHVIERPLYWRMNHRGQRAMRDGHWKYLRSTGTTTCSTSSSRRARARQPRPARARAAGRDARRLGGMERDDAADPGRRRREPRATARRTCRERIGRHPVHPRCPRFLVPAARRSRARQAARDLVGGPRRSSTPRSRDRFGAPFDRAVDGAFDSWRQSPDGALALIILCDQFPRNMHRKTARAFAGDAKALETARLALARSYPAAYPRACGSSSTCRSSTARRSATRSWAAPCSPPSRTRRR